MLYSVGYPVNVGSLFRLAEGLAVERMYLVGGTARPEGINFNRASRGSERRIGWEIIEEVEKVGELISRLKREGYKVVAIELTGESVRFDQYQYGDKVCLILGNEEHGVPEKVLEKVDGVVYVPMLGKNRSLNVAVTGGIVGYKVKLG